GSRCRRWSWTSPGTVKILAARDVIGSKHFLVADDRIHHGRYVLSAGVGMSETERVPHLMKKNAANIRDRGAMRYELQRAAIRVENGGAVKERVGFNHAPAGAGVIGHRERARAEGLTENRIGKDDGIDAVARDDRHRGIHDRGDAHALD